MQFALNEYVTATLAHVNKRVENHGGDKLDAMDLKWVIEGPNTILALFAGLLDGLYEPGDTQEIPGVPMTRPNLRMGRWVKWPIKIEFEGSGYLLTIKTGAVTGDKLELAGATVKKPEWDGKKGNGHGKLSFTTQHVGLDAATMGQISALDQRQADLLLAPPELQSGVVPEKKLTKAQEKAKAKAEAQASFSSPFKFGLNEEGTGLVDRSPLPDKDKNEPDAGEAFASNEAAGLNKPAAKKVVKLKPKARTGKGN